ncbi:hypothetical protein Hanom_Chr10g00940961 [Helianthus anomalus]
MQRARVFYTHFGLITVSGTGGGGGGGGNSVGGREEVPPDVTDPVSDSGEKDEEVDLNSLISGIAETAEAGSDVSLRTVSVILDTMPGNKRKKKINMQPQLFFFLMQFVALRKNVFFYFSFLDIRGAAGGGDVDMRAAGLPGVDNVGGIARESGDARDKDADGLQDVTCGLEQLSVEDEGTVNLGDNSLVEASGTMEKRVGSSDVNRPPDVGKPGTEKAT